MFKFVNRKLSMIQFLRNTQGTNVRIKTKKPDPKCWPIPRNEN